MRSAVLLALLASSCFVGRTASVYDLENPPPELGRPAWVRNAAGVGAWTGGAVGAVVSVALLPVTWPLRQIRGDGGTPGSEDLLFPVSLGAAGGHFLLGAPADLTDYLFRRAWIDEPTPHDTYTLEPMTPPVGPVEPTGEEQPDQPKERDR